MPRVRIFTRKNRTATFKTPTAAGIAPDRQNGGAYVTMTGVVRHISVPEKTLVMEDGAVIALEDIATISGFPFEI